MVEDGCPGLPGPMNVISLHVELHFQQEGNVMHIPLNMFIKYLQIVLFLLWKLHRIVHQRDPDFCIGELAFCGPQCHLHILNSGLL